MVRKVVLGKNGLQLTGKITDYSITAESAVEKSPNLNYP